jgi:hypothetical protein
MAQTPVSWLVEQLGGFRTKEGDIAFIGVIPKELIDKAEGMHKEQIVGSWNDGTINWDNESDAEQYYNETFGGKI